MGKLLLVSLIGFSAISSLKRPWIGIIAYYMLAILGPQYIWFWNFEGLRASFWVAIFVLTGIAWNMLAKTFDYGFLLTGLNRWTFLLFSSVVLSYYLGPYVSLHDPKSGLSPKFLLDNTINIYLFYYCAVLAMDSVNKLKYLSLVIVFSVIYLIYWANLQYFTENWDQFNMGRLKGPENMEGFSIYGDENAFAMLFVTGIPFVYHLGMRIDSKILRFSFLVPIIAFGWHAVFLTGSRGGLLGLAATTLATVWQSKRKYLAVLLIPIFYGFFVWQSGPTMKERSATINEYQDDGSAEMRLTAWKGGIRMIGDNPVFGAGLGSFITALPRYIETSPRVAHNTLIQFAAESGILAGISYLMIVIFVVRNYRKISAWCKVREGEPSVSIVASLNDASTVSFIGLVICSIFLSLNNYEIFLYLLIMNNALFVLCSQNSPFLSEVPT